MLIEYDLFIFLTWTDLAIACALFTQLTKISMAQLKLSLEAILLVWNYFIQHCAHLLNV
jgi:hypothetical protein